MIAHSRPGFRPWNVLVLGSLFLLGGCGGNAEAAPEEQPAAGSSFLRVINVEVQTLEPGPFLEIIRVTGTVQAGQDVTLSAEEPGRVMELLASRGSVVRAGDPLVRIDDALLRPQVDEAVARAALAQLNWERRKVLFEQDGVGTEVAYLEARLLAEQAQAQQTLLRERLDRTLVRAPFAGVVDERWVEVGTLVAPGSPVIRIVQLDPLKVVGGVPERFAGEVRAGGGARVSFDVLSNRVFDAQVRYAGATVNPRNRTFEVEVSVPNPGQVIKPEMVANLELFRRDLPEALVVPQNALVRVEEGFVVFVVEEDASGSFARVRPVRLGPSQRNQVVIEDGLQAGDRVIIVGQNQVANGDRVQVLAERSLPREAVGGER